MDPSASPPTLSLCRAKVYTADLESALHYLLRVELATHDYLEGEELNIFKDFVTVVAKVSQLVEHSATPTFTGTVSLCTNLTCTDPRVCFHPRQRSQVLLSVNSRCLGQTSTDVLEQVPL